jgi:hypothetical protein
VTTRSDTDDVVAIWRLQSAYADIVNRRAWPELHGIFVPDATVHLDIVTSEPFTLVGPDEIGRDFIGPSIEKFDHFSFVILNTVVDVEDETTAKGRIFMMEVRHETATNTWPNALGVYEDRYTKRDGRWWIESRRYRSLARQGPEGVVLGAAPGLWPIPWAIGAGDTRSD